MIFFLLTVVPGCATPTAHFTGSLADIKEEQRSRLYMQCIHDTSAVAALMPDMRGNLVAQCRNWGRQMVR
jgi:hypothetical protein